MMYTSPKFESEEAARSQVEPLQNQQRPILGCHGGQLPPVHIVEKTNFRTGSTVPQILGSAVGAANKPFCRKYLETGYLTTNDVQAVCNRCACNHYQLQTLRYDTRLWVVVGFGEVQPGFLQLILTQTWVKCTLLDSSRCVVYSGIRFKAIQAASKKIKQDERLKVQFHSGRIIINILLFFM